MRSFLFLVSALLASCGGSTQDSTFYCGSGTSKPCSPKTGYCQSVTVIATLETTTACETLPASCSGSDFCTTCLTKENIPGLDSCRGNKTDGGTAYVVSVSR